MKTTTGPVGKKGPLGVCPNCGGTKTKWDSETDTNVCRECGWTDKEKRGACKDCTHNNKEDFPKCCLICLNNGGKGFERVHV